MPPVPENEPATGPPRVEGAPATGPSESAPGKDAFRVLFVCTGNICRSPLAERLLRPELGQRLGDDAALFEVESSGVRGLVGEEMDPYAAAALAELGGDAAGFVARRTSAEEVRRADLVLVASRKHRSTVVRLDPTSARRTFTMREFARLARSVDTRRLPAGDPRYRLRAAVDEAATNRGLVRADDQLDDDIRDPFGGPASRHRESAEMIAAAIGPTVDLFTAVVHPGNTAAEDADDAPRRPAPRPPTRTERSRRRRTRRLLAAVLVLALPVAAAVWLAWEGLEAKRELETARGLAADVRTATVAGDRGRAERALQVMQRRTARARNHASGVLWSAGQRLPVVGDDLRAVRDITVTVNKVARDVLPPLVEVGDSLRPEKLRVAGNRIDTRPLAAAAPKLQMAAELSATAKAQIDAIDGATTVAPIRQALADVRAQVDELAATTDTAATAAQLLPPMLGLDGPRRYFLAFQNNAEARGTGGLLGAYGVLEADDGRLRVAHLGPNTELESPEKLPVDLGPDYRRLYGASPPLWVNGNASPHFPYAGRIWLQMWQRQHNERLDGVIATDPVALGQILEATGPTKLPGGGKITADNAADLTMRQVYARFPTGEENTVRDQYLQTVAGAVFAKLLSGTAEPQALAERLAQAAGQRRLLVYSDHPAEQARLAGTTLSGLVPKTTRPFAGLVVNNFSGSKLDYYLDRRLEYDGQACPAGAKTRRTRIDVTLTNTAPPHGLPEYVDQRLDTEELTAPPPKGSNTDVVHVYATAGAELVAATIDGKPLLVTPAAERGHPVFEFPLTLLAGESKHLVLELEEPIRAGKPMLMQPQPLITDQASRLTVPAC